MGVEERSHILKNTLTIHVVRDTKRIDEGGQLIPEGDEFCWDVLEFQKENIFWQIRIRQRLTF